MQVHVANADIATLAVDAVVNPANSLGIMGGGVAGRLRHQGGDSIQAAAMNAAPIAVGAAVVTEAGALPCKHVIHAPIMDEPGQKIGAENVRRAARAALIASDYHKFKVIAFVGMGSELGEVPRDESARAIVEEIRANKKANPEIIYLVDTDMEMVEAFQEALTNAQHGL